MANSFLGPHAYLEGAHERLIHTHHGAGIVKLSAVVGSREQGDELPLCEKLVTIFHHLQTEEGALKPRACAAPACARGASPGVYLVRPADKVHVVFVQKFGHHVCPECEGDATVVFTPAQHVLVWVGPQQVTQQTLVRHVCGPHDSADLLHGLKIWREAWRDVTHPF